MPALIGFISILCSIYAVTQVATSDETAPNKTAWALLIVFIPLLGFIVWVVSGPRGRSLEQK